MDVLIFFGWIAFSALVSWLTAFQMPDGYGNAIFGLQIVGAVLSAGCMAMGLPTAIDPSHKVVVTGRSGTNFYTTWPRAKGVKIAVVGGVIFLAANIGGWVLDNAMGLPVRYAAKVQDAAEAWARETRPPLDACLASVWTPRVESCDLRLRATASGGAARLTLRSATCSAPQVVACVERHVAGGVLPVDARLRDSIAYTGAVDVDVHLSDLRGTGPPPPAERLPPAE